MVNKDRLKKAVKTFGKGLKKLKDAQEPADNESRSSRRGGSNE